MLILFWNCPKWYLKYGSFFSRLGKKNRYFFFRLGFKTFQPQENCNSDFLKGATK